jgi:hypothetical protein
MAGYGTKLDCPSADAHTGLATNACAGYIRKRRDIGLQTVRRLKCKPTVTVTSASF